MWWKFLIVALCGYLLGSINPAIIVSKLFMKQDIRKMGSGNAGSTNALRTMGGWKAAVVIAGDILKTVIASLIGQLVLGGTDLTAGASGRLIGGVFTLVGHVFPLYFGFKGGKAVLASAAMVLCFDPRVFILAISLFFVVVLLTRYVSLGSMVGVVAWATLMIFFYPNDPVYVVIAWIVAAGVILLHRKNIVRLLNGTESKFGEKKKAGA